MVPPPVTPSPHRFIVKKQPPVRPVKQHQQQQQQTPVSSTPQFSVTPRFNTTPRFTHPTPHQLVARNAPPLLSPLFGRTAHRPSRLQEIIEDEDEDVIGIGEEIEDEDVTATEEDREDEEILEDEEDIENQEIFEDGHFRDEAKDGFPQNQELKDDIQQSIEEEDMLLDLAAEHEDDICVVGFQDAPRAKRRRLESSPLPDLYRRPSNRASHDEKIEEELDDRGGFSSSITEVSSPLESLPRPQVFSNKQSRPALRFLPSLTPQPSRFRTTVGVPSTPVSSWTYIHPPSTTKKSASGAHIFAKPPRFRPPSPTSRDNCGEPLPDAFSPSRRGEKYLIGGLASELRSWIINIGNEPRPAGLSNQTNTASSSYSITNTSMVQAQNRVSNKERDQWRTQIIVDEMSGGYGASQGGMTLIRGRSIQTNFHQVSTEMENSPEQVAGAGLSSSPSQSTRLKIMLAGTGLADGLNRTKRVEVGFRIGIHGPTWEVDVGGEKWRVVVKWRVM